MLALSFSHHDVYSGVSFGVEMVVGLGLSLVILLVARTLYLLNSIHKIRRKEDPRTIVTQNTSSPTSQVSTGKSLKTLVVLGSGGHTTEMLHLIQNLDPTRYGPITMVVANTDTTSLKRVVAYPYPLPIRNKDDLLRNATSSTTEQRVYRIPRSREVGQSYGSSVLTTLYSFVFALWLVGYQVRPDLILVNGPGTCLPIAYSAFFFRLIGWKTTTKIIFVESFCRVKSLSLTGKLLYPIADLFAVCWEQLHEKYPRTYLVTSFIRKSDSGKLDCTKS